MKAARNLRRFKVGGIVDTYSRPLATNGFTKATTIFTVQFDDVRVSLIP